MTFLMQLSLIICTHNPRPDCLGRALEAVKAQTLPKDQWELLVVDNASTQALASRLDLSWHPVSKVIREDDLGLTPARLRGIRESKGDLLILVDDDNILDSDYLQRAIDLSARWPMIGVYGGSCRGEFEIAPISSIRPFLSSLAVSEIDREHWSNAYEWSLATPYGAGMCIRRNVAAAYERRVESKPFLKMTDRRGTVLTSGGDNDIVWTAIDLGLGSARFPSLKLTHMIASGRLTEEYMVKLHAGFEFSTIVLDAYRASNPSPPRRKLGREIKRLIRACLHRESLCRRIEISKWKARQAAFAFLGDANSSRMRLIDAGSVR